MYCGRDTRSWSSVPGRNDFLRVQEVDTQEPDRVESDKDECKDDGDVRWNEVVIGDLGSTNSETELYLISEFQRG